MRKCPRCGREYERLLALSRVDNKTKICDWCGTMEAMESLLHNMTMPASEYVVKIGDSLQKISKRTGTDLNELLKINDISHKNIHEKMMPGKTLLIPTRRSNE